MKIKTEKLIEDLKMVEATIGKLPMKNEYKKIGKYSVNTICRRFGSWNEALLEIFGEVKRSSPQGTVTKKCDNPNCVKTITFNKSEERDHNFCSQSCSAIVLNKVHPKRKFTKTCTKCKMLISKSRTYCEDCFKKMYEEFKERKIGELLYVDGPNRYGSVRRYARMVTSNRERKCYYCGYDKHVQTCHIKPISSFPLNAKLEEVNAEDNLLLLCPNCHWELDHDL
jgi:hypothetical protein